MLLTTKYSQHNSTILSRGCMVSRTPTELHYNGRSVFPKGVQAQNDLKNTLCVKREKDVPIYNIVSYQKRNNGIFTNVVKVYQQTTHLMYLVQWLSSKTYGRWCRFNLSRRWIIKRLWRSWINQRKNLELCNNTKRFPIWRCLCFINFRHALPNYVFSLTKQIVKFNFSKEFVQVDI